MHIVPANQTTFAFRPDAEPVLRVRPGDIVRFETSPEPVERLFAAGSSGPTWLMPAHQRCYRPGLRRGRRARRHGLGRDACGRAGRLGLDAASPGPGCSTGSFPSPCWSDCPFVTRRIVSSGAPSMRPMIGCLGLAPATGATSTLSPAMPWAGNYDLTQLAPGATVLFPAQVAGGLFSLGDLHAAMGAREPTFVAIECAGAATVRLDVRRGWLWKRHASRPRTHLRHRSRPVRRLRRGATPGRASAL